MSVNRSLERDLRRMLHLQLDSVLDASAPDAGESARRVIDDVIAQALTGKAVTVSVHTLPKPATSTPVTVPAEGNVPARP